MKKFLLMTLFVFWILVVVLSPIYAVILALAFLIPINGWFGLLAILIIPAFTLSVCIFHWSVEIEILSDAVDVFDEF